MKVAWDSGHFMKGQGGLTYIPFTVAIDRSALDADDALIEALASGRLSGDDLHPGRQPQRFGDFRFERTQVLRAWDQLRELVRGDTAISHQAGVVMDRVRAAVVSHPGGHNRVIRGGEAAR